VLKKQKGYKTSDSGTHRKRKLVVLSLIAIILIAVATKIGFSMLHKSTINTPSSQKPGTPARAVNSVDYSKSSQQDNALNEQRKSNTASAGQTLDSNTNKSTSNSNMSITITRAGVVSGTLQVGTLVDGASTGTCTLNLSQSGQRAVTQTKTVEQENNTYACPVFNVPTSQLTKGAWSVSVTLTTNGRTATGQWANNPVMITE
jgi:hypothetical protein